MPKYCHNVQSTALKYYRVPAHTTESLRILSILRSRAQLLPYALIDCLAPFSFLFGTSNRFSKSATSIGFCRYRCPALYFALGFDHLPGSHQVHACTTAPFSPGPVSPLFPGRHCSLPSIVFPILNSFNFCRVSFTASACGPWVMTPRTFRLPPQLS